MISQNMMRICETHPLERLETHFCGKSRVRESDLKSLERCEVILSISGDIESD